MARLQIWSPHTFLGCQGSWWISTPNQSRCRRARNATWKPPWCAGTFDIEERRPLDSISCVSFWTRNKNSKLWIFLEILPFQPYPKRQYFTAFSKPLIVTPVSNEISPVPTSTNTRPKLQREEVVVPNMPYLSRGFGRSQFLWSLSWRVTGAIIQKATGTC